MVTVRPLAENGQWQYKTEKEYLCIRDGEETDSLKRRELAKWIAKLSRDIEELRSEKAIIPSRFDKTDDDGMKEVKNLVASMESSLQRLEQTEAKYQAELDAALAQFRELTGEAESMDKDELRIQRQTLRKSYAQDARDKLQQAHGKQYSAIAMMEAQRDVDHLLWEDERKLEPPVQKRPLRHQPEPQKKPPNGTMKDNGKSWENQEKSDSKFSNNAVII